MKKTYKVNCFCSNCDYKGLVEFPYGTAIATSHIPCPHCGCKTLSKQAWSMTDRWVKPSDPHWDLPPSYTVIGITEEVSITKSLPLCPPYIHT